VESSRTAVLEFRQGSLAVFCRTKRSGEHQVHLLIGQIKDRHVGFEVAVNKFPVLIADLFVFLGDISPDVGEVREELRKEFFQADTGFVESFDWEEEGSSRFDSLMDYGQVVERPSAVEEIDLAIGLGMDVLLDELGIGEIAK